MCLWKASFVDECSGKLYRTQERAEIMDGSRLDTDMEVARRWKPSQIWWAGSLDTRGWSLRVSTCKLRTRNLCMLWTCYDTSVWFVLLLWELASYFIFFLEPSVSQIPLLCMAGLLFVFHYSQKRRIRQHIPAFNFEKKTPTCSE